MGVRPSDLYQVEDPVAAYCFDRAVYHFGTSLKAELEEVQGKTEQEIQRKRLSILSRWIPEASTATRQRFRDPAKG